jgi:nucleotide-binding universal stress UspA family protein
MRFGALIAGALATDVLLLGVVDRRRKVAQLGSAMDEVARELAHQGLAVDVRVEVGSAQKALLDGIKQGTFDLIAVSVAAANRAPNALLVPVAGRILEQAQGSVLFVKGDRQALSRVLICSSATEQGRLPIRTGAEVACATGAQATVLHVLDALPAMYTGLERMEETLAELLQCDTAVAQELKWAAQIIKAKCKPAELKLRRGIVADEIVQEGEKGNYDLIVLGSSRSPGKIVRVLMGDVTAEVVGRAQRPVLVVRPPEHGV